LFSERTYRLGSENAFRIGPQIGELERQGHKVIKCNLGEPDFPLPRHIADEIKRQIDLDLTHYCDPQGILPLREAIARRISRTRKIDISPDRVVVFPGGKPPIGLTEQTYCNPGDEVIYPSPGFPFTNRLRVMSAQSRCRSICARKMISVLADVSLRRSSPSAHALLF
jgi:aspartate/methionine/tyrosine aminotransferase